MNNILTDEAKSFKIIRPKVKTGAYKPNVVRLRSLDSTIFLPLVRTEKEIFTSIQNLFGFAGSRKYFMRYYFPKRYIYQSVLYLKPKVMEMIDIKRKRDMVKTNFSGFRGIPNIKLIDRRNVITDYTDIMNLVIPTDRSIMGRSSVITYLENIYPEIICYLLFKNANHDKSNDIESEEVYNESFSSESLELLKPFIEESEDDFSKGIETFTEKLFAKTKLFSMSGPAFGLSEFGFTKYIISIPFTMTAKNLLNINIITGRTKLIRPIKINPNIIYQLSLIKYIYACYKALCDGSSSDEFVNELIKYNVVFHLYANNGTGICINLRELKDNMSYKPTQMLRLLINRLHLFTMINTGMITDTDLDKLEAEENEREFDKISDEIKENDDNHFILRNSLKSDISSIIENDLEAKTVIESVHNKDESKVSEIEETPEEILNDDKKEHFVPTAENIYESNYAMDKLKKLAKKFSAASVVSKIVDSSGTNEEGTDPIELDDKELSEILEEENADDTIDNVEEEIIEDESDVIEEIVNEQKEDDELYEKEPETDEEKLEEFESKYDEVPEEKLDIKDMDNTHISSKPLKKQPIKLATIVKKEPVLKPAEIKRINNLKNKYKSLKIDNKPFTEVIGNSADIDIKSYMKIGSKKPKTADESVFDLSVNNFQKSYVKNNYQSDLINSVRSLSMNKDRPLYITKADVEDTSDQYSEKLTYKFVLEDEFKKKHNLKFDVPKLDENGLMKIAGIQKFIKKQLIRNPIVKIGPDKVYITTQMNSYQVSRHGTTLNKSSEAIRRILNEFFIDNPQVKIERGNCEADNTEFLTTLEYDLLAKSYFRIKINDEKSKYGEHIEIYFSQKIIRDRLIKYNIKSGYDNTKIPDNILPIAINYTKGIAYSIDINQNSSVNSLIIGLFNEILNDSEFVNFVKQIKTPKRRVMSKVEIQSFKVPLIVFLNYTFGWEKVQSYFKENEIEFSPTRIHNTNKLSIRFFDGYLYYNQFPLNGALLINGLTEVDTENYEYKSLLNPAMYTNFVQNKFKTRNVVKGWTLVKESMLDYKTLQILEALHMPTDLLEIFLYCNDLLTDNQVKDESDISNYRLRSNEIISECLYKVLNEQYTTFKKQSGKRITMTIPQNAVLSKVFETEILMDYDCLSPVAEIRNAGLTTFKGPGGTKLEQAFTKKKRAFDPSYFGVFSMSTPDNSNAGVVKELSLNTKIENTLGFIGKQDDKFSLNDVSSIAEALVPFVTNSDDPSRIAFTSGQNQHVGGLIDSSLPCIRTGVEKTIHLQCGDNFCKKAKKDGIITDISDINKQIFIKYNDGTKEVISYENKMLKNSDAFNESFFDTFVKVGEKIKAGDLVAVDGRFFKKDPFTGDVIYTQSRNALVGIHEGFYSEDDSDLLSESFTHKLKMNFTKRKQIAIKPKDTIINYKNIGDHVKLGDIILTFDNSGAFDDESDEDNDLLQDLYSTIDSASVSEMIHKTPKANLTGIIKDIKVYWTIPINQMSKSVATFVKKYIERIKKQIIEEEKFTGKPSSKRILIEQTEIDRKSGSDPRINGCIVDRDGAVMIEYLISNDDLMSTGDKITLNSSLKTVNGYIVEKDLEPYTESGLRLDGIFSFISQNARMVESLWYNFLGTLLYKFSKKFAKDFLTEIGEDVPFNEREVKLK